MNFIKLIPILFLAHSPVGDARPTDQQVLPAVPGYIPVYIQTGNVPPDVEALYKSASSPPKRETSPRSDDAEELPAVEEKAEDIQQELVQAPMKLEIPKEVELPKDGERAKGEKDEETQPDPKKEAETVETGLVEKTENTEDKLDKEEKPVVKKKEETRKAVGQIREIPQYEVKELQE